MTDTLARRLANLQDSQPATWAVTGAAARPNLHAMLRYPAMMVPMMQGDIVDTLLDYISGNSHVVDPFVGSGTVMTESLLRGLDFTGIDINPLAILVCEAKAAIDMGADITAAANATLQAIRFDVQETVDVDFPGLTKWFDVSAALQLSRIRRAITQVPDQAARKVVWTVFTETIRLSSNSRTSTYKLHMRAEGDRVAADRILQIFEDSLRKTLLQVAAYRKLIGDRPRRPDIKILCGDARAITLDQKPSHHNILVTSPPYGDNQTTIPYGQFSYLALRWIPIEDLNPVAGRLTMNTNSLDSVSLGGSVKFADVKAKQITGISPSLDRLMQDAATAGTARGLRKVVSFMTDFFESLDHLRKALPANGHWVLTTGNRTASGRTIPFDSICREMLCYLGGRPIATVHRRLPVKRMPSKNNMGLMITTETTLVAEFH
ncbi:hypothetical protein G6K86_30200 [Agrobacterium rhizogenes]|nr:hypothetical protein [Rhizobium rhizogenes]